MAAEVQLIRTKVAGVSHQNEDGSDRQELIRSCEAGDHLFLVRDPDNEYDDHAVAVHHGIFGQIGFIGSNLSQEVAEHMDSGRKAYAVILTVTGGDDERPTCGVNIQLVLCPTVSELESDQIAFRETEISDEKLLSCVAVGSLVFFLLITWAC